LALITSLAHGFIHAMHTEAMLLAAWLSLLGFSAVGYLVGWIAGRTVEESVSSIIEAELAREESSAEATAAAEVA
jgi:hypothetical protein